MKDIFAHSRRYLVPMAIIVGLVVLIILPPLLFAPDIRDKDFPHSGVVLRVTDTGFVLGGKRKDRELIVTTTASTTVRGEITVGEFVQAFGTMTAPGQVTADRVQVMDGPRKKDLETP